MSDMLNDLTERFPPPSRPRGTPVNWENLEAALGLRYPTTFKEFIDVYGGCVWFDNLSPFFRQRRTKRDAKEFPGKVVEMCDIDRGHTCDERFDPISPPFYPETGGLLPFLVDYGGAMYYWDTQSDNPDEWPIVMSNGGWMTWHPCMSTPAMILKWLKRDPQMVEMWGDVEQLPPEPIRITES